MSDLADLGVGELLDAFGRGSATPVDALEACLARIDARNDALGAVVLRTDDRARAAARESAHRWQSSAARPLEGIPFGVKDVVATAGITTSGGSLRYRDWVPTENATAVQRLLEAGGVLVGKLATPEFAFGDARDGHVVRNPHDPERWAGGSSSGSAAALAARMLPIAVGTDTGGSIRVPASYCGVCGLKPTFGRVPTDGVMTVSWTLDHTGPMARSVDDLARAFSVMAAADVVLGDDVSGVRVGIPTDWFLDGTDHDVLDALQTVARGLAARGATVHEIATPHAAMAGVVAWTITVAEFATVHDDGLDHLDAYTPAAAERLRAGASISAREYLRALRARALVQADFAAALADVDVVLSPATPTPAPRVAPPMDPMFAQGDRMWLERVARNFLVHNVTGMPAVVVPAGVTAGGLPVAVQFASAPHAEERLLSVARTLQLHASP